MVEEKRKKRRKKVATEPSNAAAAMVEEGTSADMLSAAIAPAVPFTTTRFTTWPLSRSALLSEASDYLFQPQLAFSHAGHSLSLATAKMMMTTLPDATLGLMDWEDSSQIPLSWPSNILVKNDPTAKRVNFPLNGVRHGGLVWPGHPRLKFDTKSLFLEGLPEPLQRPFAILLGRAG